MEQQLSARRRFLMGAGAGMLTSTFATVSRAAAGYPVRPITLIVPFPPGGSTDGSARLFAKLMGAALGQTVVVDNRPGAGGTLGGGVAARAAPDGYTLLWGGTSTIAVAPAGLYASLPYDPVKSFQPIGRAVAGPLVLCINKDLDCKNVAQLVALARQRPGQLNFGSSGVGTNIHLTAEMFKASAGIDIAHIPYKGAGYIMTDLISGRLQLAFLGLGQATAHTSDVRLLATTGRKRSKALPNVPTMIESGQDDFESVQWFGLLAPAGIPADVQARLSSAYSQVTKTPEFSDGVATLDLEPVNESAEQFAQAIVSEGAKWKVIIQNAHISL